VDRLKIAQRLSEQRPEHLPPLQVCIQVNVDGGDNKSGVSPQELPALAQAVAALPRLQLRAQGLPLDTLSMGMSADMTAAIAEGSTMVRVGTGIFGARH
jgi:uncharacterized pyridoxal phosphate-containing UPF0001 family protein